MSGGDAAAVRPVTCTVLDAAVGDGAPGSGTTFPVGPDLPVLHAMIRAAQRCIPVGCRGGGCGACRVRVVAGSYSTRRMSRRHVTVAEEAEQIVLACRLLPSSDIVVERAPAPAVVPYSIPLNAEST
ncbi:MAG: 2Fe-2S iron-sulfur cluster binding domain-containing protein [Acidimicrobiales bacterium]